LVDEIGNLDDAIDEAARLAGITDYKLKNLPKMLDPFEELVKELGGETSASTLLAKSTGKEYQWIKYIQQMEDMVEAKGVQARLPFFIEFK
jgi:protease-4